MSVGTSALEIVIVDPFGNLLATLDEIELAGYGRALGMVGSGFVTFDADAYPRSLFPVDGRIEFWREVTPGRRTLDTDTSFLIRRFEYSRDEAGVARRTISGPSAVEILSRRIDVDVKNTDGLQAGLAMRELVVSAFASGLGTGRNNIDDLDTGQPNSVGPNVTKPTQWRNILDVLQEISTETLSTSPVFFDVVRYDARAFSFQTYAGQRGADRGSTSGTPLIFSAEMGNLSEASLIESYEGEVTDAYTADGKGTASNAARRARSPINRRETYVDSIEGTTTAAWNSDATSAVNAGRPSITTSGSIVSVEPTIYGRDWGFGDKVVASVGGDEYDVWVNAVEVAISNEGKETVMAKVESVDAVNG